MTHSIFWKTPIGEFPATPETPIISWLWDGYLAPGKITLLTSQRRTGKTTLVTGLLGCLGHGEPFLGRILSAGQALIVSEDSRGRWAERVRSRPVGGRMLLIANPFVVRRPTFDEWNALIAEACQIRRDDQLDLFIIDSMVRLLPPGWESNTALLVEVLEPLRRLTAEGTSILLVHRFTVEEPSVLYFHRRRRNPATLVCSARGSGALLDLVDISVELCRYGRSGNDLHQRQIVSLSRNPGTPERLAYEWDPMTGKFADLGDPNAIQFERNWEQVRHILKQRQSAATHRELLMDWPAGQDKPAASVLYEWLNRAFAENRVCREGRGTSSQPWRYRLKNEDDEYYDRGEMPPLREMLRRK
jgi:hypothetical protein